MRTTTSGVLVLGVGKHVRDGGVGCGLMAVGEDRGEVNKVVSKGGDGVSVGMVWVVRNYDVGDDSARPRIDEPICNG